ncbi:hypothetical protein A3K73_01120 [Candidatus Pacearchaeota archaeon RBG_13_36_9]|nr:MAG: hypothetical protein A3K73_01120 [Candidatus Pacearchaeota archaeon RBG_13_36_9]
MGVSEELNALVIGLQQMIDLVLVIGILLLIVVILRIIEKSYRIRLEIKKRDRNLFYKRELKNLRETKGSPEKILDRTNIIARGFFKEAFNLPYNLEYLELLGEFRKSGKTECIDFCELISELNYSGNEISPEKIALLLSLLEKIMQNNRILSEEDKILLKKNGSLNIFKSLSAIPREPVSDTSPSIQPASALVQPLPDLVKRVDINHINWKYKLRILLLRLRGRIPELRKVRSEWQKAVPGADKNILDNEKKNGNENQIAG